MHLTGLSFAYPDVRAGDRAAMLEPRIPAEDIEVFFLATCLRIEIAWAGGPDLAPTILEELYGTQPLPVAKMRVDFDAFHHLSRVAAGLESALVGEAEVLSQFRQALVLLGAPASGESELVRRMEIALSVARAARRSLTANQDGSLGVAAARLVDSLPEVVVLGGGAMARAVVRELDQSKTAVYARRPEPVAGVAARPWDDLPGALRSCRAVVSTIPGPVHVLEGLERPDGDPLLLVDLGMPPAISNTDPGGQVTYRGVDDVATSVRSEPEPAAEETVANESERAWGRLSVSNEAGSIIASVVDRVELTIEEEVRRFAHRLPAASEQVLRQLAHTVARRIIHPSVSMLGSTPLAPEELDVVARAFGVDRD